MIKKKSKRINKKMEKHMFHIIFSGLVVIVLLILLVFLPLQKDDEGYKYRRLINTSKVTEEIPLVIKLDFCEGKSIVLNSSDCLNSSCYFYYDKDGNNECLNYAVVNEEGEVLFSEFKVMTGDVNGNF